MKKNLSESIWASIFSGQKQFKERKKQGVCQESATKKKLIYYSSWKACPRFGKIITTGEWNLGRVQQVLLWTPQTEHPKREVLP